MNKLNICYLCDITIYNFSYKRNIINLINQNTHKLKYCTKLPKSIFLKKRIGYLYLDSCREESNLDENNLDKLYNLKWLFLKNRIDLIECLSLKDSHKLVYLNCSFSSIKVLKLNNKYHLKYLDCANQGDLELDLENTYNLKYINITDNQINYEYFLLKYLKLNKNIRYLSMINAFDSMKMSNSKIEIHCNPNTLYLDLSFNRPQSLHLKNATNLKYLNCRFNSLKFLDLKDTPSLRELNCRDNNLDVLNLNQVPYLKYLDCRDNNLKKLNLNQNILIEYLDCRNNPLKFIDIETTPKLKYIRSNSIYKNDNNILNYKYFYW